MPGQRTIYPERDASFMVHAACKSYGPDVFFSDKPADVARAKIICASCPVIDACRRYACDGDQQWESAGVWGGMDEGERRKYRRALNLGLTKPKTPMSRDERIAMLGGHGRGAYRAGLCNCEDCMEDNRATHRRADELRRERERGIHRLNCKCQACRSDRARAAGVGA